MKTMIGFLPRLTTALAAATLCFGIACSDNPGNPDADVYEDAGFDDTSNDDVAVAPDNGDRDTQIHQDLIGDLPAPEALELVERGKEFLSAGESLPAMDAFYRAMELDPDLKDARLGMVLARFQSMVDMWGNLIGLVNFKDDPDEVATPLSMPVDFPTHPGTIGANVDSMYTAAMAQKERLEELKTDEDEPVFVLEGGLPLSFKDDLMMNLCCEWDISDVYAISSFNNLMLAFVSFLGSQDTDISFQYVEDSMDVMPLENTIVALLDEYPEFLTLLPEHGDEIWLSMKPLLLASINDALESARLMGEGNDLSQNVATLSDDEKPYLVLHGTFPSGVSEMEFLWEGKTASMKAILEKTKAHFEGVPDSRLSLDADVLVAIGVLVDIINRTIGIQTIVEGLGISLPDIVTGLMGTLDPNDPEQLVGLLGSMTSLLGIPAGSVELNLGAFLDSPFNVRDMLPWYGPIPGSADRGFTRSFECVRGGATLHEVDSGNTLQFFVHDPAVQTTSVEIPVISYATTDGTGTETDNEIVTLAPVTGFTGVYTGTLDLTETSSPTTPDDGAIALPAGGSIGATYVSSADASRFVTISGNLAAGITPWDYTAACVEESTPWDGAHFSETEFNDAVEVLTPGVTEALPVIPADGRANRTGSMAFRSPSFDNLLWLKSGETMAVADQAGLSGFIGGVMAALEAF